MNMDLSEVVRPVRILGIDPGTHYMGIGVICSEGNGDNLTYIHSEVLVPNRRDPIQERLHQLHSSLGEVVSRWKPSHVAMEQPFVAKNVRSALAVGQAQAVGMIVSAAAGVDVYTYSPSEVKSAVTDHGGSSKEQVQEMVAILLELSTEPLEPDAADALAVAICHLHAHRAETLKSSLRS